MGDSKEDSFERTIALHEELQLYSDEYLIEQKKDLKELLDKDKNDEHYSARLIEYMAVFFTLAQRSKEKRRNEIFSKTQAATIMWSTVVIAFFTAYPTLKDWALFIFDLVNKWIETK